MLLYTDVSHLLESGGASANECQAMLAAQQLQSQLAVGVLSGEVNIFEVRDAVLEGLPELIRVESLQQLSDRSPDQQLLVRCDGNGLLVHLW